MARLIGCTIIFLLLSSALSLPQGRKYIVKNNNPKKVFHKMDMQEQLMNKQVSPVVVSLDGENPHQSQLQPESPWSFLANSIKQILKVFFGPPSGELSGNGLTPASDKMDGPQQGQGFSWGQVIGYGLKLLFVTLGGGETEGDGIDKIGVEASPVQGLMKSLIGTMIRGGGNAEDGENIAKQTGELINLVIALMNALKTSFSQRAIHARSAGESNKLNDMTLASIDMGKGLIRTINETNTDCKQRRICEAAAECVADVEARNSGMCHFASYATVNLMYYTQPSSSKNYKLYLDAARRGRQLQADCKRMYVCNEV